MSKRNKRRTAIGILAAAKKDLQWRHDRLHTELGLEIAENKRIRRLRIDDRGSFLHLNVAIHKSDIAAAHDCDCKISDVFNNMKAKFIQAVKEELKET